MAKNNKKQHLGKSLVLAGLLFLGACGVRPGHVDPPAGVNPDPFPQTYPEAVPDPASASKGHYLPENYNPPATTPPSQRPKEIIKP